MQEALIKHINRLVTLTAEEADVLQDYIEIATFKKKQFLLKEGQVCTGNYFVVKGLLRSYFITDNESEQMAQFALENWWLSDYLSYGMQTPSQFYIQAVEETTVIIIRKNKEAEMFEKIPKLERYFRLVLQKAYGASQIRLKYIFGISGKERYDQFNALFPEFVQRIPQYMLASYLGFSAEFLSKIRANKV